MIDESDKKANYLLRFCQPITDTISFIFKYIDPTDEEELINCACSTGKNLSSSEPTLPSRPNPDRFIFSVSLTVHLWGGEGCQNLFEGVNLAKINVLLEHVTKRNQRLLLKSIRKGIQVHTCLGPFFLNWSTRSWYKVHQSRETWKRNERRYWQFYILLRRIRLSIATWSALFVRLWQIHFWKRKKINCERNLTWLRK